MKNMNQLMKQAKKLQDEMMKAQEALGGQSVEGTAGGVVTVAMTGHREVTAVTIKPEAVDPDDIEMLQDLVLTAMNDALKKVDDLQNQTMGKYTQGMNLPGMF